MNNKKDIRPPRWAEQLLSWYCRPEMLEDLQGDLNEYFQRNVELKGARRARLIYVFDVLKFFRTYTVRKPKFLNLFIQWIMIGSYIKTSGRSIVRNKLFSVINIVGLAISMSVGLIMISILSDIFSYDKFHENHGRIVRVISRYQFLDNKDDNFMATTSLKAGRIIQETFSQPEAVAMMRWGLDGDWTLQEKTIPLQGFWANENFFNVFSFKLLQGNPETALREPFSIVLTESAAKKLFGTAEILGKTLAFNKDKMYTVTGIVKDPPNFSYIKFEILASMKTRETLYKDSKDEMKWDNVWNTWVYMLLPENTDLKPIQTALNEMSLREDKTVEHTHVELRLQAMDDIMTGEDLGNQSGPVMGSSTLWIFGGLAFIVILSACFNYTNLSIARALRRTREVGIRKVIGALRGHVLGQFLVEAILISLCALLASFVLFLLMRPYFLGIEPDLMQLLKLELSPKVILYFVLLAVGVGIAAGVFPALFFAKVNAISVLRDVSSVKVFKKLTMRKILVVFQYCISIMFITGTVIVYKQYRHFVAFDLGFKTENILNISLQGNKPELLKKELSELPEVKAISQSLIVTSVGNYWGTQAKYHTHPNDSAGIYYNTVDENYLPIHEHKLLAGRNFTAKADSLETEVIVNEDILKRFNIAGKDPNKALDEILRVDGKDLRIIGVMKDFSYGRANNHNKRGNEVVIRYSATNARFLNLKIQSTDILATHEKIEAIWKKYDPIHPFEARFYNEQIEEAFAGLKASVKIAGVLAGLAICIASMGLLGMVVFTTETRLKEISIRKVMGASESGLLFLLGRSFFILLAVAAGISLPATYLFFEQILFPEINNHAPIGFFDMVTGIAAVMGIAILMITSQTLKVVKTNPAEVLKNE